MTLPEGATREEIEAEQEEILTHAYADGILSEEQFSELTALQADMPEFIVDIVSMFVDESATMMAELEAALGKDGGAIQVPEARTTLHKLKGSSSTVGAAEVEKLSESLRTLCAKGEPEACHAGGEDSPLCNLRKNLKILNETLQSYAALQQRLIDENLLGGEDDAPGK